MVDMRKMGYMIHELAKEKEHLNGEFEHPIFREDALVLLEKHSTVWIFR